jgi:hypothetical protein
MDLYNKLVKIFKEYVILIGTGVLALIGIFILKMGLNKVFSFVIGMVVVDIIVNPYKRKNKNNS